MAIGFEYATGASEAAAQASDQSEINQPPGGIPDEHVLGASEAAVPTTTLPQGKTESIFRNDTAAEELSRLRGLSAEKDKKISDLERLLVESHQREAEILSRLDRLDKQLADLNQRLSNDQTLPSSHDASPLLRADDPRLTPPDSTLTQTEKVAAPTPPESATSVPLNTAVELALAGQTVQTRREEQAQEKSQAEAAAEAQPVSSSSSELDDAGRQALYENITTENQRILELSSSLQREWNALPFDQRSSLNFRRLENSNGSVAKLTESLQQEWQRSTDSKQHTHNLSEAQRLEDQLHRQAFVRQKLEELSQNLNAGQVKFTQEVDAFSKLYKVVPDKHKQVDGVFGFFNEELKNRYNGDAQQMFSHRVDRYVAAGLSKVDARARVLQEMEKLMVEARKRHNQSGGGWG